MYGREKCGSEGGKREGLSDCSNDYIFVDPAPLQQRQVNELSFPIFNKCQKVFGVRDFST